MTSICSQQGTPQLSLTFGQLPNVAGVVGDVVESSGGVHDGLDAQDTLELQQCVRDGGEPAFTEAFHRLKQNPETVEAQEVLEPVLASL